MFELFETVDEADKTAAIERIIEDASPRREFFLLIALAVAMASFAVLLDSTVILIGSMLIAPILYPILSLALGVTLGDRKLIGRSFATLFKSVALAVGAATLIGFLFTARGIDNLVIISSIAQGEPSLIYAIVAAISGFAAALALVKPNLNEMLPGVAIAVSLIPPLAMTGIGLAALDLAVVANALLLFLVNVAGIVLSAGFVFSMLKLAKKQAVVDAAVKRDEAEIEEEQG